MPRKCHLLTEETVNPDPGTTSRRVQCEMSHLLGSCLLHRCLLLDFGSTPRLPPGGLGCHGAGNHRHPAARKPPPPVVKALFRWWSALSPPSLAFASPTSASSRCSSMNSTSSRKSPTSRRVKLARRKGGCQKEEGGQHLQRLVSPQCWSARREDE